MRSLKTELVVTLLFLAPLSLMGAAPTAHGLAWDDFYASTGEGAVAMTVDMDTVFPLVDGTGVINRLPIEVGKAQNISLLVNHISRSPATNLFIVAKLIRFGTTMDNGIVNIDRPSGIGSVDHWYGWYGLNGSNHADLCRKTGTSIADFIAANSKGSPLEINRALGFSDENAGWHARASQGLTDQNLTSSLARQIMENLGDWQALRTSLFGPPAKGDADSVTVFEGLYHFNERNPDDRRPLTTDNVLKIDTGNHGARQMVFFVYSPKEQFDHRYVIELQ